MMPYIYHKVEEEGGRERERERERQHFNGSTKKSPNLARKQRELFKTNPNPTWSDMVDTLIKIVSNCKT